MNRTAQQAILAFGVKRLAEDIKRHLGGKVSEFTVYAWLHGRSSPRPPKALHVARIVPGVTLADLLAPHEPADAGDHRKSPKKTTTKKGAGSTASK